MTYQCFDLTIENHIAHIVMNRPEKRNSMIPAYWDELPIVIEDIENHGDVRVVVISSTGPHFTAGMDVSSFGSSLGALAVPKSGGSLGTMQGGFLALLSSFGTNLVALGVP